MKLQRYNLPDPYYVLSKQQLHEKIEILTVFLINTPTHMPA